MPIDLQQIAAMINIPYQQLVALIVVLAIVQVWSLIWKGIALWKAAMKKHLVWFVVLLVVNTVGILEILYIFLFSEIKITEKEIKAKRKKR